MINKLFTFIESMPMEHSGDMFYALLGWSFLVGFLGLILVGGIAAFVFEFSRRVAIKRKKGGKR